MGIFEVLDDCGNVTETLYCSNFELPAPRFLLEVRLPILTAVPDLVGTISREGESIFALSPEEFELLIAELLSRDGWEVQLTARTKDDNVDLFAAQRLAGIPMSMIVQCKRWSAQRKVGVEVVRTVMYSLEKYQANVAMLATTSKFTKGAIEERTLFHRWRLDLKDHDAIVRWYRRAATLRESEGRPRPDS